MSTPGTRSSGRNPEWATVNDRVQWLVKERFEGNRTAMARAIGFSHTVIANVVKGKPPGRRLLEAIAHRLGVDLAWLRAGEGRPPPKIGAAAGQGILVHNAVLPGPAHEYQTATPDVWMSVVPEVVPSPTRYWLSLRSSQPIVRQKSSGFLGGDYLLMESDPAKFPKASDLRSRLCGVPDATCGGELRLAHVTHYEASNDDGRARLLAEFPEAEDSTRGVVERVYRHLPDGEIDYFERRPDRPEPRWQSEIDPPEIRYSQIVSVWLQILHRPMG